MAQDPLKFLRDRQGPARAPLITEPGGPQRGQPASAPQRPSPAGNRPIPPSRQAELQSQEEAQARPPAQAQEEPQQMEAPVQPAAAPSPEPQAKAEGTGRLIVGPAIKVKGEIGACDTLVVQGEVEASMSGRVMEVASGGLFKGKVELEEASVSGKVEGTLTVSGLLTVARGGVVRGKIRYGELQIESGGVIAGDVGLLGDEPPKQEAKSNGAAKAAKTESDEDKEEKTGA
jgi:cytoskeletal protein CcmA (bactofilin family)